MAKTIRCDKCHKVTNKYGEMNCLNIEPYVGINAVNSSRKVSIDLCKDCLTEFWQWANNEIQMIVFNDEKEAAGQNE